MNDQLSHEKLDVYQRSLDFVRFVDQHIQDLPRTESVVEQLDRASTSIPLNISEGNGKYREKDRCSYFDNARGSAFECSSCLDVMVEKGMMDQEAAAKGKEMLRDIISMLVGLIKSNSDRAHEGTKEYAT